MMYLFAAFVQVVILVAIPVTFLVLTHIAAKKIPGSSKNEKCMHEYIRFHVK